MSHGIFVNLKEKSHSGLCLYTCTHNWIQIPLTPNAPRHARCFGIERNLPFTFPNYFFRSIAVEATIHFRNWPIFREMIKGSS
jgi:hypothetical protein